MGDVVVPKNFRLVILESPYRGESYEQTRKNILYARACVKDCVLRGESPYPSHLLLTQAGILDDTVKEERDLGLYAGLAWKDVAEANVFYTDLGMSSGMRLGMEAALENGRVVEERSLGTPEEVKYIIEQMGRARPAIDTGILF